jgi:hypothetical protein
MILKKEYKNDNIIKNTLIDYVDKIDEGFLDDGTQFINIYRQNRKREDDFENLLIKDINVYLCNDQGKTLQIFRG